MNDALAAQLMWAHGALSHLVIQTRMISDGITNICATFEATVRDGETGRSAMGHGVVMRTTTTEFWEEAAHEAEELAISRALAHLGYSQEDALYYTAASRRELGTDDTPEQGSPSQNDHPVRALPSRDDYPAPAATAQAEATTHDTTTAAPTTHQPEPTESTATSRPTSNDAAPTSQDYAIPIPHGTTSHLHADPEPDSTPRATIQGPPIQDVSTSPDEPSHPRSAPTINAGLHAMLLEQGTARGKDIVGMDALSTAHFGVPLLEITVPEANRLLKLLAELPLLPARGRGKGEKA